MNELMVKEVGFKGCLEEHLLIAQKWAIQAYPGSKKSNSTISFPHIFSIG